MKQIEVQIMGNNLMLGCPENKEAELLAAATLVDSAMCTIRDSGKTKARERVAVLAALNIAVESFKKNREEGHSIEQTHSNSHATEALKPEQQEQIAQLIAHIDQVLGHDKA